MSWHRGIVLGIGIGLAGILLAISPAGRWLEEEVGLSWLFQLRGPITPPSDVVVVSIDLASSRQLNLPNKPRLWPRSLHADLVNRLHQQGATAIFFDMIFEEPREPDHNQLFAAALRNAHNVVLFQYLHREILPLGTADAASTEAAIEKLTSPLPVLRDAAFGLAPFPLPKVPAKVNHFVLFKSELGNAPTVPVTMLQTYTLPVYDTLLSLLQTRLHTLPANLPVTAQQLRQQGNVQHTVTQLRELFLTHPQLANALHPQINLLANINDAQRRQLQALLRMYSMRDSAYLNFYGPPRSVTTVPYYQVIQGTAPVSLAGKAIFVGFSEEFQPEQKDGFYTVFTNERSGLDISGVEVGATAFANLLQHRSIVALTPWLDVLVFTLWGLLLGIGLRRSHGIAQFVVTFVFALAYLAITYLAFAKFDIWLPLVIPLLWQLPLTSVVTLSLQFRTAQRERRNIRQAFGHHLPLPVVDQLARGIHHLTDAGKSVFGIVLATDAEKYTTLSETLPPAQLHAVLNRYYEALFPPIRTADGVISDVVGDAVLSIWATPQDDTAMRTRACAAALAVRQAVDEFNAKHPAHPLPTRIGLHCGDIVMGHVGAADHYEYRAVGDIVNTATRIEGLNKLLRTRILVSTETLENISGFISRDVGTFLLAGKRQPVTVHELINTAPDDDTVVSLNEKFALALALFRQQAWEKAERAFSAITHQFGEDGPTRYYLSICVRFRAQPPENWDGVIRLNDK